MFRLLALAVLFLSSAPAFAMPQFLQLYQTDPFRNPNVDGCTTCHMSAQGGDARNAFGTAFENAGEQITPMLRAQFPDRFVYPVSRIGQNLMIHFSDPDKKQVVVETGGVRSLVDAASTQVNGVTALATAPAAAPAAPPVQEAQFVPSVPIDPYAREGAFLGSNVVNLPNGKPQPAGGVDFFIGHRFTDPLNKEKFAGLLGFDGGAAIGFGLRVGITDRLSMSLLRSNLSKTVSLASAFQISRQGESMPLTMQLRVGADGPRNFGIYHRSNDPRARQYSPVLQFVSTRTFRDRVSVTLIPTFAFNSRDELRNRPGSAFGADHNNTVALGVGLGFRFLRSASIVGEYIPPIWGFKGGDQDHAGMSVGLQKSTNRHTFELVLSKQLPMTPALYSFQGVDNYRIGFNIYRRVR